MNGKQTAARLVFFVLTGICIPAFLPGCAAHRHWVDSGARADMAPGGLQVRTYQGSQYHYRLGRHLQDRQKCALAIQEFRSAIKMDPEHVDAFNAMGLCLDALARHEEAARAYHQALHLDPDRGDVFNNLGYSNLVRGSSGAAVYYIDQALKIEPDNNTYHNNLGIAYVEEGHFDAALEAFRQAADTPEQARRRLAGLLSDKGYEDEARRQLIMADSLENNDLMPAPAPEQ